MHTLNEATVNSTRHFRMVVVVNRLQKVLAHTLLLVVVMIAHTATALPLTPFSSAQVPSTSFGGHSLPFSTGPVSPSFHSHAPRVMPMPVPAPYGHLPSVPYATSVLLELDPTRPMECAPASWLEIWTRLMAAELRFKKAVWNDGRCIAVFRRNAPNARHYGLTPRERTVLIRTLQGERQKLIAAEAKIAASTVANSLKSARVKLGFEDRLDAAPLATLLVANGGDNASPYPQPNIYSVAGGELYMASSPRPDWSGFPEVTKSERAIALAIIEGQSNTEIARSRDTSVHTVENQVASLFRKVNASGRFDLIRVLYQRSAANPSLLSA